MDQDFSKFSEEIYYEEKPFHKNKEIQIKRMFSTSFQKPKSVTVRSWQEKWIKYVKGV